MTELELVINTFGVESLDKEIDSLKPRFDFKEINEIPPADFDGFGVRNSHEYRKMFLKAIEGLEDKVAIWVVILSTAVKNKKRIMSAMTKFSEKHWYEKVRNFFDKKTCQYTADEDSGRFSVVHIPSCVPWLAATSWKACQMPENRTVSSFLSNLWACQIRLCSELLLRQKEWEVNFWDNVVKKGGSAFEKGGFKPDYWYKKAGDIYPLVWNSGDRFIPANETYTEEELKYWLSHSNPDNSNNSSRPDSPDDDTNNNPGNTDVNPEDTNSQPPSPTNPRKSDSDTPTSPSTSHHAPTDSNKIRSPRNSMEESTTEDYRSANDSTSSEASNKTVINSSDSSDEEAPEKSLFGSPSPRKSDLPPIDPSLIPLFKGASLNDPMCIRTKGTSKVLDDTLRAFFTKQINNNSADSEATISRTDIFRVYRALLGKSGNIMVGDEDYEKLCNYCPELAEFNELNPRNFPKQ